MSTLTEQVSEFHRVMGQPVAQVPQVPSEERVRLRARLITEEFFELLESMFGARGAFLAAEGEVRREISVAKVRVDLPELADAMGDLDYVVEGTRLEFGVDGAPVAAAIHAANMAKANGPRREDGKIMKPSGWSPPDIAGELRRQGAKRDADDFAKAEKIPLAIYAETFLYREGHGNDGYVHVNSVHDLVEAGVEWAWGTSPHGASIDLQHAIDCALEDHHDDAIDMVDANKVAAAQKLLNEALADVRSWIEDRSVVVLLPKREPA